MEVLNELLLFGGNLIFFEVQNIIPLIAAYPNYY